jgi:glycosyltransferase involved in cell wall biosynthesis
MNISCVIPVHNAERYLSDAIDSALAQDWPLHEIVAVDDGSTDGSAAILRGYQDRIRIVTQTHSGVSAARNTGLRAASGDVLAFLDADDIWPVGRLSALAGALMADASADIVAGLVEILDQRTARSQAKEDLRTLHRLHLVGSMLIRRTVFDRVGLFNESLKVAEDTEFIMRARHRKIPFTCIDVTSLVYRLHPGDISQDIDRIHSSTLDAFRALSLMRRSK